MSTSFIVPVQSNLFREVIEDSDYPEKNAESLWVIAKHIASGLKICDGENLKPQQTFQFQYEVENKDNLYPTQEFVFGTDKSEKGPMNGLIGYFELLLYKDIKLSTLPSRATPGLTEWLPVFFPCSFELPATVTMSRKNKAEKVWYEWSAQGKDDTTPAITCNKDGRHWSVNLAYHRD
jgi:hypothetical protein